VYEGEKGSNERGESRQKEFYEGRYIKGVYEGEKGSNEGGK